VTPFWLRWTLRLFQAWDRLQLRLLCWQYPGLEIDPSASTNFASSRFELAPGSRLRIGPRVATERIRDGVRFKLESGSRIEIGPDSWLRSELGPVNLVALGRGHLKIGRGCVMNGCHLSAKTRIDIGEGSGVGPGSRVFDADQHPPDDDTPERSEPVSIGDWVWVAADVTVLRGVEIGSHSVIRTRSLVTKSIPAHTIAHGIPATPQGKVGDRKHWLGGDPSTR
jgi:maltose O-acetyltransferase